MANDVNPPARTRGPARSLDVDRVVDAALALLDRDGAHALGIRAVAARLGVHPNALYTYVEDRAALERAVVERVLSLADVGALTAPDRDWRERITEYAIGLRRTLHGHPGAASLLMSAPMDGVTALTVGERLIAALEDGGLSPDDAARGTWLLIVAVIGAVALDVAEVPGPTVPPEDAWIAARQAALEAIDHGAMPRTAAATPVIAGWVGEAQFRWSLGVVLDGLGARARP
ncbi:MAG TPA: TetR/AcrR family transcriptional regulator C-terminal domain-containing protein [Candidatus Limnocylindrales bacterium]|nr:TetR/AcrR family transcriptional regulator C-terminal domain-containing protein [Candidatus Limnocylindrales bacterium]